MRQLVLRIKPRSDLDIGHVKESHLAFLDRALVEDFGRNRFGDEVNALLLRLVERSGKQAHLELKRQHIHARRAALAAFGDDFFNEETSDWEVDRADDD